MLDISHIAHLFSLKHSKISSHIFDDASYFFDDARNAIQTSVEGSLYFIVKDK